MDVLHAIRHTFMWVRVLVLVTPICSCQHGVGPREFVKDPIYPVLTRSLNRVLYSTDYGYEKDGLALHPKVVPGSFAG